MVIYLTGINQKIKRRFKDSENLLYFISIAAGLSVLFFLALTNGVPGITGANSSIHENADEIGGGENYTGKICGRDSDKVVEASANLSDLRETLEDSSSGETVFLESEAVINLGFKPDSPSIEVPENVTLSGDRGCDGSEGALLTSKAKNSSEWEGSDTIKMNDDSRITGLRIEGPYPEKDMNWLGEDHDYTDGVVAEASGVQIDNNEIYGWPGAAVRGGLLHVHHNFIHDNDQRGLGYEVASTREGSVIEYNRFNTNRHAVAGTGEKDEGYIVRYNVFGSEGIAGAGHKIDMHGDDTGSAGSKIEIYRNTIRYEDAQAVYIRGEPREYAEIRDNWIYNTNDPCLSKNELAGGYCAIQLKADDWSNLDYSGNHYGTDEPDCSIGAPRRTC